MRKPDEYKRKMAEARAKLDEAGQRLVYVRVFPEHARISNSEYIADAFRCCPACSSCNPKILK